MGKFYLFPGPVLVACVMVLTFTAIVQTLGVTYGFRRLNRDQLSRLEDAAELLVLLQLLLMAQMLAEVSFHSKSGFVYAAGDQGLRYMLMAVLAVLCAMVSWRRKLFWPMTAPLACSLTLPAAEQMTSGAFPILFMAALAFWLVRCLHLMLLRRRQQSCGLSALSVKEAVDNLDSGLLFCQADGQVLLQNSQMQQLSGVLTGEFLINGRDFYEALLSGRTDPACRKGEMGSQLAYWLPDGSVWVFELYRMGRQARRPDRSSTLLLVATDCTLRWKATHRLWLQNRELEERNRELKQLLENLEAICATEQTIRAKSRVHDVLGQRISLLLRAMREQREPDEVLLNSFAQGLPQELNDAGDRAAGPLETLVEAFRGLGVTVRVRGVLTGREGPDRTLYEIAAEAVTNAVRHGYASEVDICLKREAGCCRMEIRDNGIPGKGPVKEGGGLKGMRRKAEELGGSFSYETRPGFFIQVTIPEGGGR